MHDGVAHHHQIADVLADQAGRRGCICDQAVERLDHRAVQRGQAVVLLHDVGNARQQVFTVADLRVHAAFGGQHLAAAQVGQMRGDGGGAHVHRHAEGLLVVAGLHAQHLMVLPQGSRDAVDDLAVGQADAALAQRGLHAGQDGRIDAQSGAFQPETAGQLIGQPGPIAALVLHAGRRQLHVAEAHGRVHRHRAGGGGLAHHLLVSLALLRHRHQHIAQHARVAAHATIGQQPLVQPIGGLARAFEGDVSRRGLDAMPNECPLLDAHLALGAGLAAAADRFDLHAQLARGLQQTGAGWNQALPAGWLKDDPMLGRFFSWRRTALPDGGGGQMRKLLQDRLCVAGICDGASTWRYLAALHRPAIVSAAKMPVKSPAEGGISNLGHIHANLRANAGDRSSLATTQCPLKQTEARVHRALAPLAGRRHAAGSISTRHRGVRTPTCGLRDGGPVCPAQFASGDANCTGHCQPAGSVRLRSSHLGMRTPQGLVSRPAASGCAG
jgi:hypothetical protein